ncbi:DUF3375 domain-containing protein [Oligosphaera ethanolica]|uniref:Flagellar motility protein MotE (MotC chaperone) n=1 Tax=Oligosphaera ethanolica TaxID=760260 RepID=A0AAE3VEK1_9BACT|nr:DUF3375 domain-containing protein [Oligosphaera ethanolica]MDQ0288885.1 flagellar motility protein MotE (MotC chaperone) [Oligosphaera ethanolica]
MGLDFDTLELMRQNHPAWRLLCAHYAPLVASFLHRLFVVPNARNIPQADMVEALEDELYALRERLGPDALPGTALSYLNDWAENDKGWLRKFYQTGEDEPYYDLTPATEKALSWLESLQQRSFVGTESRLLTLFELLRQMNEGSQTDPAIRIAELRRKRDDIDAEIARIEAGHLPLLDDTAIKDRFQQFLQMARELLADFREVEDNFRALDRRVRERIATWQGGKGGLLEEVMGERDAISASDQGKSFRAFWDFLMSQSKQDELKAALERVLALPAIVDMNPDARIKYVNREWLEAGGHTQRTIARLSQQLRRFLDDQAWLENRRIMDILHSIEQQALAVVETPPPQGDFMAVDDIGVSIHLPVERPLYQRARDVRLNARAVVEGDVEVDMTALYTQIAINRDELAGHIRRELQSREQVSLSEVIAAHPLRYGLSELVAYFEVTSRWKRVDVSDDVQEKVAWRGEDGVDYRATMPRVIILRN